MTGPIHSMRLPRWWDPAEVFQALYRDDTHAFWLDAGPDAQTGHSYLGAASHRSRFVTASVAAGTVTCLRPADAASPAVTTTETIFEFLRRDLAASPAGAPGSGPEQDGFQLGWVGWLGYELGAQTVGTPVHESRYPDAALLDIDRMVAFDHADRRVTLLLQEQADDPAGYASGWFDEVRRTVEMWLAGQTDRAKPAREGKAGASAAAAWRHDPDEYRALIGRCHAAIHDGLAYQLCLTNEIVVPGRWHPVDTYLALRRGSPSHHGGLLRFDDTALLSASPEQFLHVTGHGVVRTKPIKGTRRRSKDPAEDQALQLELEQSDKERAENLMIVDLMRNDLGRVAELGSVVVSTLLDVESYPHVHQLVSTIEARLAAGISTVDAVEACFPAGSMTGAPKMSAMSILHDLEGGPRGIYSGAFGYLGRDGAADLAIVIRSIVLEASGASIGTGGGITALSVAVEEVAETQIKAAALLDALDLGSFDQTRSD